MKLPDILTEYVTAANQHDSARTAACFTADAVVHDEKQDRIGLAAIREWVAEVSRKYQPRFEVVEVTTSAEAVHLLLRVSGTFPGSPVELDHVFILRDGRIAALHID